jgi:hypothetical protein
MAVNDALLPEFDQEMATTRKLLKRVPENKFAWTPHPKSGSMGWLAGHLAQLPDWAVVTIREKGFDMAPNGVQHTPLPPPKTASELLETFDRNVKAARAAIAGASDTHLTEPWS